MHLWLGLCSLSDISRVSLTLQQQIYLCDCLCDGKVTSEFDSAVWNLIKNCGYLGKFPPGRKEGIVLWKNVSKTSSDYPFTVVSTCERLNLFLLLHSHIYIVPAVYAAHYTYITFLSYKHSRHVNYSLMKYGLYTKSKTNVSHDPLVPFLNQKGPQWK